MGKYYLEHGKVKLIIGPSGIEMHFKHTDRSVWLTL